VTTVFDPFVSLALAFTKQNVVKAKVRFTPYDFFAPTPSVSRATETHGRETLLAELGRDLQIALLPTISVRKSRGS
jgi:hypothetical protein